MSTRHSQIDDPTERAFHQDDTPAWKRLGAAHHESLALVVYHAHGSTTAPLLTSAPVVVGRSAPSDVCVASKKLSRTHARFTLQPGGRVLVEDLGSTNGTWRGGERVDRAEITLGQEVLLGDALVCVHALARLDERGAPSPDRGGAAYDPIAEAPVMKEALRTAERFAQSSVPVIVFGETGTGKEVLSRFLHDRSPRAAGPFVSVNCAAIPASLLESTLFGHERGSFTGAGQRQKGVFEEADGGTLFLDEIGELPPAAQAALLRVLEVGRFTRVGSPREIAVDVRVIAATHRDLEAMRREGTFRSDLYYRLSVVVLTIPPLRERPEDIEPLARRFLERAQASVRGFTPRALDLLRSHTWPGNVRELRNTIDRAVVLARGNVIDDSDLPSAIREPSASQARAEPGTPLATPTPAAGVPNLKGRVNEYEARMLQEVLEATGWNQAEAARRLGIPRRTFAYRLKTLGLRRPGDPEE